LVSRNQIHRTASTWIVWFCRTLARCPFPQGSSLNSLALG
jgi:hypothetical protein